jgi:hypothetical protein
MDWTIRNRLTLAVLVVATGCVSTDLTVPTNQGQPDGAPNSTPFGTPITTFNQPPKAGCPTANAKTVLVDPTHDGGVWWFPQASGFHADADHQGRALANYLRAQGYTVTELARGASMAADSLLTYSVVIRAGYYYDAAHPGYSAADLAAYRAYVDCDRTLVILSEFLRDGRKDMLADSLGIPLVGFLSGVIDSFSSHAITSGVESIPFIAGSYLASESEPGIEILGRLPSGEGVLGLLTTKKAKVFFLGDVNGIQLVPQPFVSNLLAWGFK